MKYPARSQSTFDLHSQAPAPEIPAAVSRLLGRDASAAMRQVAKSLPGNLPTPLLELPRVAAELAVGRIAYKDEGGRCGVGNFKAIGAASAVYTLLADRIQAAGMPRPTVADLLGGAFATFTRKITLTTATAGSHGKAVAWAASLFGCQAITFTYAGVDEERCQAIRSYGAEVRRLASSYDDAVEWVSANAVSCGWTVISDTAYGAYREIPLNIMRGYALVAEEIAKQLVDAEPPTHIFVQAGVGGLAAAICAYAWDLWGRTRPPRMIVVEPVSAAGFFVSATNKQLTAAPGPVDSKMLGLAAGRPSDIAWEILAEGANDFIVISDEVAEDALHRYATAQGELAASQPTLSAIAGLAALRKAALDPATRAALHLDQSSRIVLIGTDRKP